MRRLGSSGFTLVELLIVTVIVAILAAIAVPTYQEQTRKARRSDAKIALEKAAAMQEQWYFSANEYSNDVNNLGGAGGTLESPEGYYTVTAATTAAATGCANDGECYVLTATPVAAELQAGDNDCASFIMDSTGARTAETKGGVDNTAACW